MKENSTRSMLVYLGANARHDLVCELLQSNPEIRFVASSLFAEMPSSMLEDRAYQKALVSFDSSLLTESGEIALTPVNDHNMVLIIDNVMSDKLLGLMWTRFGSKIRRRNGNEVKRYEVVYSLVKSALKTCLTFQPKFVLFSYEPHMLPMYVFKKVAIALGIKTYTLTISPFIWRLCCEDGRGNGSLFRDTTKDVQEDVASTDSVERWIKEKQGHYRQAKPFYEKRNQKGGVLWHLYTKLKVNGWNPRRAALSRFALAAYQRLVSRRDQFRGGKYTCMFLQYQPEQTTLPDGGLFVHQLLAIQMLYSALAPLGISLVIREHPATFESAFDPKWRPENVYQTIKNIGPNVYFDDIRADPFLLIQHSIGVSSMTGTVLLEALLRGRPAIAFGRHPLRGYVAPAFIDDFASENELRDRIVESQTIPPEHISADVERYLCRLYPMTFGPSHYPGNAAMTLEKLREARKEALQQVILQLTPDSDTGDRPSDTPAVTLMSRS